MIIKCHKPYITQSTQCNCSQPLTANKKQGFSDFFYTKHLSEKNEQGAVCGEAPEAHSARGRGVRAERVRDTDQGDQDHVDQGH